MSIAPSSEEAINRNDRALIDKLITATKLYNNSKAIQELFEFTIQMRAFAPFNAMLLHIQKPGLTHAATAQDWWDRFGRVPKTGVRPLLILRTMGAGRFRIRRSGHRGPGVASQCFRLSNPWKSDRAAICGFGLYSREREDRKSFGLMSVTRRPAGSSWCRGAIWPRARIPIASRTTATILRQPVSSPWPTNSRTFIWATWAPDRGHRVPDRRHTDLALREVEAESTALPCS